MRDRLMVTLSAPRPDAPCRAFAALAAPHAPRTRITPTAMWAVGVRTLHEGRHVVRTGGPRGSAVAVVTVAGEGGAAEPLLVAIDPDLPVPVVLGADWLALQG